MENYAELLIMEKAIKNRVFDVSIIVLTYNAVWEKLEATLDSVIMQEGISYELIIADDGSTNNYKDKIEEYLTRHDIEEYHLVFNKQNRGTVCNLFSGLQVAAGEYIKDISPGDMLADKSTLSDWIAFLKAREFAWTFSEAAYYKKVGDKNEILSCQAFPNDVSPYINLDFEQCRWNYVALDDIALGATMICKTQLAYDYCKRIINKVKYAEDNMWRLMMFDGIKSGYYPKITMLYEYGSGISTSGNLEWARRLKRDWNATNEILLSTPLIELTPFQKRIINAYKRKQIPILKYCIQGKLKNMLFRKFKKRKTVSCLHAEDYKCKL